MIIIDPYTGHHYRSPDEVLAAIDHLLNENRQLGIVFDRVQAQLANHKGAEWLALYDELEPIIDANRRQARYNTYRIADLAKLLELHC